MLQLHISHVKTL